MSQLAPKLFVVGLSICKAAALKGWQTVSLSRRGEPDIFNKTGKPSWANEVEWAKGDSLDPSSYRDLLKGVTSIVHTVGIILESDYKKVVNDPTVFGGVCGAGKIVGELVGMVDRGNPLDPKNQDILTYEKINRDTAITVANEAASIPSIKSFVYISADDIFPLINPRYITSKREAERNLFSHKEFKSIILRPGLMYSEERPVVMPLVNMLQTANVLTKPISQGLSSLPFGKVFTTPPVHINTVANAALASIELNEQGIFDVNGIKNLANHEASI
ncbi:unnamed protein product [Cunninghamella blakesleeana]